MERGAALDRVVQNVMFDDQIFTGVPETGSADRRRLIDFCGANKSRVLSAIPWVAAEIADQAGFEVLFEVLRRHGGMTCYVPHDIKRCRTKFGLDIPEKLHDRFIILSDSNGCINVPSAWGVFLAIRRVAICMALEEGKPNKDIARSFGVTDRFLRSLRSQRRLAGLEAHL